MADEQNRDLQASGAMGALAALGERLLMCKPFIYWDLAPESRARYVRMLRETARTVADLANDLSKAWQVELLCPDCQAGPFTSPENMGHHRLDRHNTPREQGGGAT